MCELFLCKIQQKIGWNVIANETAIRSTHNTVTVLTFLQSVNGKWKVKACNIYIAPQAATAAAAALYVTDRTVVQLLGCRLSPRALDFDLRRTAIRTFCHILVAVIINELQRHSFG